MLITFALKNDPGDTEGVFGYDELFTNEMALQLLAPSLGVSWPVRRSGLSLPCSGWQLVRRAASRSPSVLCRALPP